MRKQLSEMTLEELWQLFPIVLEEPKEYWKKWYEEELTILRKILPKEYVKRISHIGSTAIGGIWAKPTVDILVEITPEKDIESVAKILLKNGYLEMSKEKNRTSLNKGYTEEGFAEKVYHFHLRYYCDNDELYFRDYLIDHPEEAKKYEKLKLSLWKKHEHNRDEYTDQKTNYVAEVTEKAKKYYAFKYSDNR